MATKGFIYVASNESMQGLLKIGRSKNHPDQRMQELAGTGVPTPFHLAYLALVEDHEAAELQLHQLFNESRVSQNREFFRLDVHEALPKIREAINPLYEEVDDDLVTAPEPERVSSADSPPKRSSSVSVEATINREARLAREEIDALTAAAKKRVLKD